MALKSRHTVKPMFEMSSLTDIIFLLLIFFMLTSSFVAPNAIKLLLPNATGQTLSNQTVSISVTEDLRYYVDGKETSLEEIPAILSDLKAKSKEPVPTVTLRVDKSVDVEHLVELLAIGKELEIRMILATKPN